MDGDRRRPARSAAAPRRHLARRRPATSAPPRPARSAGAPPHFRHILRATHALPSAILAAMAHCGPVPIHQLTELAQRARGSSHSALERVLAAVAEAQHGVVTAQQFRALGFGDAAVRRRLAASRVRRLHRGVYAVAGFPLTADSHRMAAVLACGSGAALSHASAAALWRIRESAAALIDVTTHTRAGRTRAGIRVHRADHLPAAEVTEVAGIPCTTVARTIVDLAGTLSEAATEYAIHQAQTKRLLVRAEVEAVLERSPHRAGNAVVRRILGLSLPGQEKVRSRNELRLLRICRDAGLPLPKPDVWIPLPDGHGLRVDFVWREHGLIAEVDSRTFHGTDRALVNDPARDRRLMLAGWRVVRFSYRDLAERPELVAAQLHRLLTAGQFRHSE